MVVNSVILAAGFGTRMHSKLPKVLHSLGGRPLILHALSSVQPVSTGLPVVVVGHEAEAVRAVVGDQARFAVQDQQLGTAHALLSAEPVLAGEDGLLVVITADMPLFRPATLRKLVDAQQASQCAFTFMTVTGDNARGYGRVVRDVDGGVKEIVEEAQATPEILALREYNISAYCFRAGWIWPALKKIKISPKGEYYLTDILAVALAEGQPVQSLALEDGSEAIGINTRVHLAEAEAELRSRTNNALMLAGVTLIDPTRTYVDLDVAIGADTVIYPGTYLRGMTSIGEGCIIGPNSIIKDTRVGHRCTILASVLEGAELEDEVNMGPFAHLRQGAHLAKGVHMGNFGEVKNSYLAPGVKMGHFSYIGDATIGENVNIGAGTITCNFDGKKKNHTEIGAETFIGSDTMLVAPLKIGHHAKTGAGAVVTRDVPPYTLVVGVPARPVRKLDEPE